MGCIKGVIALSCIAAAAVMAVEGSPTADGRSVSVWDVFVRKPGIVVDGTDGNTTCDFYNKYPDDFKLMKSLGIKNHRFSISWGRIVPSGRKGGAINQKGVDYYNRMINAMLANGISPAATLYHWDMPQAVHDAYQGFLSPTIQDDFLYFSETCFKLFGDRIKKWITFNEPWIICNNQYGNGMFAPGQVYDPWGKWKCGHNLLLAHARTVKLYRETYKQKQGGKIGMALWTEWSEPWSNDPADKRAAQNKLDVDVGWFADTIHFGDYPALVKKTYAQYLATFTTNEKRMLAKSYDFFGITFYTGKYAKHNDNPDGWIVMHTNPAGQLIGPQAQSYWLYNVPWAMSRMLYYLTKRYNRPDIWVVENGASEKGEADRRGDAALRDPWRTGYFKGYLEAACQAVARGVRMSHYYVWSYMDNWEWREGFTTRFGIVYVDFKDPKLPRRVKTSGLWLSKHFFNVSRAQ